MVISLVQVRNCFGLRKQLEADCNITEKHYVLRTHRKTYYVSIENISLHLIDIGVRIID